MIAASDGRADQPGRGIRDRPVTNAGGLRDQKVSGARRSATTEIVSVLTIIAFAVLVGVDGPAPWPIIRAAVVLLVGAGALLAERRVGPRASTATVFGLGIAGLIAGLGIGVSHVVNVPWSAEPVAGLFTLLGGLALVAAGSYRLISMLHRWWKLLALDGSRSGGVVTLVRIRSVR